MVTASPLTATPTPVTAIPAATATPTLATVIRVATVTPTLATVIPVATVTPTLATAIPVATATAATEGTTATTKDIATAATQGTVMAETERTATAIIGYRKSKPYRGDAANKWRLLQKLLLFEIVRVLVRLDPVASNIVNTDQGIM